MPTAKQIEWWLGLDEPLAYETAEDLGIGEFVHSRDRYPMRTYRGRHKAKLRKKARLHLRYLRHRITHNPWEGFLLVQSRGGKMAARADRRNSYANLRMAWEARRRNCARRRAEKAAKEARLRAVEMLRPFLLD